MWNQIMTGNYSEVISTKYKLWILLFKLLNKFRPFNVTPNLNNILECVSNAIRCVKKA